MTSTDQRSTTEQAENWLTLLQSGRASAFDKRRFDNWVNENEDNAEAYDSLSAIWNSIPELIDSPAYEQLKESTKPNLFQRVTNAVSRGIDVLLKSPATDYRSFSPIKLGGATTLCSISFAVALFFSGTSAVEFNQYNSGKGQLREITLSDGSTVTLSAQSSIEVRMSDARREISLTGGQAFFSVEKDSARPFFVSAGSTTVQVIGTQFDVNKGAKRTKVTVLEGIVQVSKAVTHEQFENTKTVTQLTLRAGDSVEAKHQRDADFQAIQNIDLADISPWREGRLRYINADLIEIATDANRFFEGRIILANPDLAGLKVTTSFKTHEIKEMVDDLAQILPVKITHLPNNEILIAKRNHTESLGNQL